MEDIFYLVLFSSIFIFILVKIGKSNFLAIPSFFYAFNKQSLQTVFFVYRFFFFFQAFLVNIRALIASIFEIIDAYNFSAKAKFFFLIHAFFEDLKKEEYIYLATFSPTDVFDLKEANASSDIEK